LGVAIVEEPDYIEVHSFRGDKMTATSDNASSDASKDPLTRYVGASMRFSFDIFSIYPSKPFFAPLNFPFAAGRTAPGQPVFVPAQTNSSADARGFDGDSVAPRSSINASISTLYGSDRRGSSTFHGISLLHAMQSLEAAMTE
jgi:hypothetical protein